MDKSWKIYCICVLFFILAMILNIYESKNYHIVEGDCFDEKNNKINELTCDIKIIDHSQYYKIVIYSLISIAGIVGFYSVYLACKGK